MPSNDKPNRIALIYSYGTGFSFMNISDRNNEWKNSLNNSRAIGIMIALIVIVSQSSIDSTSHTLCP